MASFDSANAVDTTDAAVFIPELWSDEIIASYKENLVAGSIVTRFDHQGRKGDTIHLPSPTRLSATAKAQATPVTLLTHASSDISITINQHFEYSVLFEDHSSSLALDSIRNYHTDDAGHALAKQVDDSLLQRGRDFQSGDGTIAYDAAVIGSDGSTAYVGTNEAALADAGLRRVIQTLDDADVPQSQRFLVIPPVSKNSVLGLDRFTEQAFVGEVGMANSIRNGRIGNIYGVEVLVSTNCETATGAARICLLMHRSAIALAMAIDMRVQMQYLQEHLGTLLTADTLYGTAELRTDAGVAIAVTA